MIIFLNVEGFAEPIVDNGTHVEIPFQSWMTNCDVREKICENINAEFEPNPPCSADFHENYEYSCFKSKPPKLLIFDFYKFLEY